MTKVVPEPTPAPVIPQHVLEQAMLLLPSLKEQCDKRLVTSATNIVSIMVMEAFQAGYAACLREHDLTPQDTSENSK